MNFVTAHDGFTLADLVSYDHKDNAANGEGNRDGTDDNRSWNCGVEGPTDDPQVLALRARQRRNLLTTLFVSQGLPMTLGGDELGRSQGGNNNAYCQDNEVSWYDWESADEVQLAFTKRLIELRHRHPLFRRRRHFRGREPVADGSLDLAWLRPDGVEMTPPDWETGSKSLGVYLNGEAIDDVDANGEPVTDDSFLLLFNAHHEAVHFVLPAPSLAERWAPVLDTARVDPFGAEGEMKAGETIILEARCVLLLQRLP